MYIRITEINLRGITFSADYRGTQYEAENEEPNYKVEIKGYLTDSNIIDTEPYSNSEMRKVRANRLKISLELDESKWTELGSPKPGDFIDITLR